MMLYARSKSTCRLRAIYATRAPGHTRTCMSEPKRVTLVTTRITRCEQPDWSVTERLSHAVTLVTRATGGAASFSGRGDSTVTARRHARRPWVQDSGACDGSAERAH